MKQFHKITNLQIQEKKDKNGNPYYILFDNDKIEGQRFFYCFDKLKEGWQELKAIEIEYEVNEKGNKITNIVDYGILI